jgi:hypothetical protein
VENPEFTISWWEGEKLRKIDKIVISLVLTITATLLVLDVLYSIPVHVKMIIDDHQVNLSFRAFNLTSEDQWIIDDVAYKMQEWMPFNVSGSITVKNRDLLSHRYPDTGNGSRMISLFSYAPNQTLLITIRYSDRPSASFWFVIPRTSYPYLFDIFGFNLGKMDVNQAIKSGLYDNGTLVL